MRRRWVLITTVSTIFSRKTWLMYVFGLFFNYNCVWRSYEYVKIFSDERRIQNFVTLTIVRLFGRHPEIYLRYIRGNELIGVAVDRQIPWDWRQTFHVCWTYSTGNIRYSNKTCCVNIAAAKLSIWKYYILHNWFARKFELYALLNRHNQFT